MLELLYVPFCCYSDYSKDEGVMLFTVVSAAICEHDILVAELEADIVICGIIMQNMHRF